MDKNPYQQLFDVQGKIAVITGGGGVLCGAMGVALGRAGARVAVLDIIPENARKVVDAIESDGGEALAIPCDVLDVSSIQAAADQSLTLGDVSISSSAARVAINSKPRQIPTRVSSSWTPKPYAGCST